jgi:riboflavin biosynthesis pyrimidine reductase
MEVLELPSTPEGLVSLDALLGELGRREWTNLLVEGGARALASFIHAGLADELLAFVSPTEAPAGAEGLPRFDVAELDEKLTAGKPQTLTFGLDRLLRYLPGEKEPLTE